MRGRMVLLRQRVVFRLAEERGERSDSPVADTNEVGTVDEELALRVSEVIEALRPVLEGLADDPSE